MTGGVLTCAWCGASFEQPASRGPTPLYCRRACRQRAYEHRHAAAGPPPASSPSTDALDALSSAARAAADAPAGHGPADLRRSLDALVRAAQRVLVEAGRAPIASAASNDTAGDTPARPGRRSQRRAAPASSPHHPAAPHARWDAAPPGAVVYRRRRDSDRWVVERWDHTADGWLSRPLDVRTGSPYPWTTDGRRSLIRALLSDVLDAARHGATLPVRGADTQLDQLAEELLPVDDTAFDLDRQLLDDRVADRWALLADWLSVDEHGRHHQWRLVETRHDDDTPTVTPSGRAYDALYDAKQALRRLRAELTRDHPERRARGDRFDLEELHGAGKPTVTPPRHPPP